MLNDGYIELMVSLSMKDIMNKANRQEIYWDGKHAVSTTDRQTVSEIYLLLLLLLSLFSRVQLCATPETAAHQAPPSLGFSRQEHWSGLPFPSPMHESEKWKWSCSFVSDSSRPHGLQPTRLLHPWIFQARVLEWVAIAFSISKHL